MATYEDTTGETPQVEPLTQLDFLNLCVLYGIPRRDQNIEEWIFDLRGRVAYVEIELAELNSHFLRKKPNDNWRILRRFAQDALQVDPTDFSTFWSDPDTGAHLATGLEQVRTIMDRLEVTTAAHIPESTTFLIT